MDNCEDLMPTYLSFVKGVVDSEDLPLNVSRETLQQDRKIAAIRKFLVRKVMEELGRLQRTDAEAYRSFWTQFGSVLKEGLLSEDKPDPIFELMLCHTTRDDAEVTTLDEYITRTPESQDAIYYLAGPTTEAVRRSPHLEVFLEKGYEVLLFTDRVDNIWLQNPPEYKNKRWASVGCGSVELGSEEERKTADEELQSRTTDFSNLMSLFHELLDKEIKEVRITNRLTSSPACLVSEVHDLPPQMIEVLRQVGRDVPNVKRILELNPKHPIMRKLLERFQHDEHDVIVRDYAELIYGQAILAEGGQPSDPALFSKRLAEVMEQGL